MKRRLTIIFVLIVILAIPATSFSFFELGKINQYISYDRFKVISPSYKRNIYHPILKGRLINETNEEVHVFVHIYFCDIFRERHNKVTLSISMQPKEKFEFKRYLQNSELERAKYAHHLEFQIDKLWVGRRNIGKQYIIRG